MLAHAGAAHLTARLCRFTGCHIGGNGINDGIGEVGGLELCRINGDHDLGQAHFIAKGADRCHRVCARQDSTDHIQQDGKTAALPVANGDHAAGLFNGSGVGGQAAVCIVAAYHRQLFAGQTHRFQLAVAELAQGTIHHDVLPVRARHGQNERVVADVVVLCAPCRHVGAGVGPADADAARVCGLPAVGAAAHPVVVVAQRHHANTELMCQLYGTVHGVLGVQRAKAALAIPALHGTKAGNALGLSGGINLALAQVFHHAGEAVQPVAEHAGQTVLGKDLGCFVGTLWTETVFGQDPLKFGQHRLVSNAHGLYLLYVKSNKQIVTLIITSGGAVRKMCGRHQCRR